MKLHAGAIEYITGLHKVHKVEPKTYVILNNNT